MKILISVSLVIVLLGVNASGQSNGSLTTTWKAPQLNELVQQLQEGAQNTAPKNTAASKILKFTPAGDSGVLAAIADAVGKSGPERSAFLEAMAQIKQAYEAEVAREGKSNNVAAAMTFFVVANIVTYHQSEMPSEADTDHVFNSLQQAMAKVPVFASMSNAEKHRMHDWLVYMGGFGLTNYTIAKERSDAEGLATIRKFADFSMQLVLGIEAQKMNVSEHRLVIQGSVANSASPENNRIVGAWTYSSAQNMGHMRLRYIFNADGTYRFKSERNHTSQRWWTIEEAGMYSINGNSLTISPKTSKATSRDLNGVVQQTKANPLEQVTYKWTTHFFEGIGETNLVLEPPQPTSRDGVLGSNSLFPRAYLYSQGDRLEWRF